MNAENNIRVEMIRMEGGVAPFVQVSYIGKDAQERTGLFLLDSGSNENILSSEVVDVMGSLCVIVDGVKTIASMAEEPILPRPIPAPIATIPAPRAAAPLVVKRLSKSIVVMFLSG